MGIKAAALPASSRENPCSLGRARGGGGGGWERVGPAGVPSPGQAYVLREPHLSCVSLPRECMVPCAFDLLGSLQTLTLSPSQQL